MPHFIHTRLKEFVDVAEAGEGQFSISVITSFPNSPSHLPASALKHDNKYRITTPVIQVQPASQITLEHATKSSKLRKGSRIKFTAELTSASRLPALY
ncbi:hypothetical protein ACTXT7_000792 [Hymenolepis weldensis]